MRNLSQLSQVLVKGRQAFQDWYLLKLLQSEIEHELSSKPFQDTGSGSQGDFVVDWDSPESQDLVLRRKCQTGEEVVVSALLGPFTSRRDCIYPRDVLMKVCLKKPGLSSLLLFNCEISGKGSDMSDLDIHNVYSLQKSVDTNPNIYRGPKFCDLDPKLQEALKEYLVAKGIRESLSNYLLHHLHKKEHIQYIKWLKTVESMVASKASDNPSQPEV